MEENKMEMVEEETMDTTDLVPEELNDISGVESVSAGAVLAAGAAIGALAYAGTTKLLIPGAKKLWQKAKDFKENHFGKKDEAAEPVDAEIVEEEDFEEVENDTKETK